MLGGYHGMSLVEGMDRGLEKRGGFGMVDLNTPEAQMNEVKWL